jgi:hypothetical protein
MFDRGIRAAERSDWPEALECFTRALEMKRKFPLARSNRGMVLARLGRRVGRTRS